MTQTPRCERPDCSRGRGDCVDPSLCRPAAAIAKRSAARLCCSSANGENDERGTVFQTAIRRWRPQRLVFRSDYAGTGTPGIFTLTAPNSLRVVKYRVFQSAPPKARLVVAEAPCTIRPSFLPFESITHNPPGPPQ
jgi:hypothetical protein